MSEMEWLEIFSDNLVYMMREQGYSAKELADAAGLDKSTVSNYINKQRIPSMRSIINLAYVLGCDLNDFIDFGDHID